MRKITLWLGLSFLLVAALVLIGCPALGEEEKPKYDIAVLTAGSAADFYWNSVRKGVRDAAEAYGVNVLEYPFSYDVARAGELIDMAIAKKVDGIIICLVSPALNDQTAKAMAAGIPVVAFNQDVKGNPRLSAVWHDMYQSGILMGQLVGKMLPEGSHILMPAEIPGASYATLRVNAITKTMDALGKGFTYEVIETGLETSVCYDRITAYMLAHPETKAIIGIGAIVSSAAGTVIKDLGLKGKVIQTGYDPYITGLENIKDGYTTFILDDQPYLIGFMAVTQMYLHLDGMFELTDYDTGMMVIDSTNIDKILALDQRVIR